MTWNWQKYLELCVDLVSRSDEAYQRTTISRAYYCAFHEATGYVERQYQTPISTADHTRIINALEQKRSPNDQPAAEGLKTLKRLRRKADYEADWRVNLAKTAEQAVSEAIRVLRLLKTPLLPAVEASGFCRSGKSGSTPTGSGSKT